ncbi:MAG TPA: helix-turn-helix domain-containing protein [Baekduia sp.]|nr:helix-turn-helix domain-containing protein [Baekduia sp.]
MPRVRSVSDEKIVIAALSLIAKRGTAMTLAEVGDEVGLSAATVVQRFGSKRALKLEIARIWARLPTPHFHGPGTPIERLYAGLASTLKMVQTPDHVNNMMAVLHVDLVDDAFRTIIQESLRYNREMIRGVLQEALEAGDLRSCDTHELAGQVQVVGFGALHVWAIQPDGDPVEHVVDHARLLIDAYRPVSAV